MFDMVYFLAFLEFVYLVATLSALRFIVCNELVINQPMVYGPNPKDYYDTHDVWFILYIFELGTSPGGRAGAAYLKIPWIFILEEEEYCRVCSG